MRKIRSKGVAAIVVFVGAISLGLGFAGPAGALFQPETTITDQPPDPSNSSSASFSFDSSVMGSTFECQLDGGGFSSCNSPTGYSNLADGSHTFDVQATDPLFPPTTDPTPASYTWTVDTTGPDASIDSGSSPAAGANTSQTSVHMVFSAPGAAGFECSRDSGAFNSCSSPEDYTVGDGSHSFRVRALDSLGNVGATAQRNWSVDTTGPTTSIDSGPSGTTNSTNANFSFSATGGATGFECSRDGGNFSSCSSPQNYTVAEGSHSFAVRATDGAGNVGNTATRSWNVVTTGPTTVITNGPSGTTNQTAVHITFSAAGATSYECSRDGAVFSFCTSPEDYIIAGDGSHSFSVRAIDGLGNIGASTSRTWTLDTTGPVTSIDSGPSGTTNSTNANFSFSATGGATGFECSRDGAAFSSCSSPQNYTVTEGSHSFAVRATDGVGNVGNTATRSWNVVTTGPTTTIDSGPSGTTNQTSVHFAFSSSGATSFQCSRDGAGFSACSSPQDYTVTQGSHSFAVRGLDSLGNIGAPASRSWTVDTTGPSVSISSGPTGTITTGSASFAFSSSAGDLNRFECKVDGAPFTACSSPANYVVGDGPHVFQVQGVDNVGNTGSVATRSWTVDASPPDVTITNAPSNPSGSASASFSFTSTATDLAGFECKLDSSSFSSCSSPQSYNSLSSGSHTFRVHSKDGAGNTSSDATYTWTVDTGPPDVPTITGTPANPSNGTSASFTFSSTAPDVARYECRMDADPSFTTCSSPANYGVGAGSHTFRVRAVDTANNTSNPATYTWTVDLTNPDTSINSGPGAFTNQTNATFTYSSTESGSSFQCHLDAASWGPCPSNPASQSYNNIGEGSHTFYVRAIDPAGNTDQSEASYTWNVIVTAPQTTITSGPNGAIAGNTAQFGFTSDQGGTFECSLDPTGTPANSWATCASPKTNPNIGDGTWTFSVRATNLAGTTDPSPDARTFTVDTTAPVAQITSFPPSPTNQPFEGFGFSSNEPNSTFQCTMDSSNPADFAPCTSPAIYNLGDGQHDGAHTFRVRAVDPAPYGNLGPVVSRAVTIDTTPPDTTITSAPHNTTSQSQPQFTFNGTGSPARFECRIDSSDPAAFNPCTSPYTSAPLTNSQHTFEVRSVDAAGNPDPSPASETFTVETLAPDTLIDTGPEGGSCADPCFTRSASVSFSFHADKPSSTFQCQLTGPGQSAGFTACTNPKGYSLTTDGSYTFSVRAVGAAGMDQSPATKAFTLDRRPPVTTIIGGPLNNSTVNTNSASFTLQSDEANSTFACKLDTAPSFTACTSPLNLTALPEGQHTLRVIATDQAGNADLTQDQRSWTVDTLTPTVSITGPTPAAATDPALTNSKTPTFSLSATEAAVTFECALDPPVPATPTFTPCSVSYTAPTLADGPHRLSVRGKDAGGNLSPVATKSFTVDATAPEVQFDLTPAPISNATDATFQFSVKNDPTGTYTFQCKLDIEQDFTPCTSPKAYSGLPPGQRNIQVKATDTAGNTGPPTTYRWTIDITLPQTQIGSRPRPVTNATTAVFDFQSPNTSPVTFQCNLDKKPTWTDCTAQPLTYTGLGEGNHTFEVKAINSAGTEDPDPATYSWTVDTADPDTTIGAAPPGATTSGFATFTFASEAGASFECRLDGSAWTACSSPKIYGELPLGQHSFGVRGVDEAGNRDRSPATRTWTVVPAPAPPAAAASGPNLINPFPVIRIAGTITKRGVRLRLFLVNAPAGSKVSTRCRGKGCPFSKKSRAARALRLRTVEKKFYPAGVRIEVFVTKPGMIGKYTRFKIRKGKSPVRTDRCLPPGSLKPVRCS